MFKSLHDVLQVTLVSNLESFGFNLQALAHVCQRGIAASCGLTRSPGARSDQLMLQGDQVPSAFPHLLHLLVELSFLFLEKKTGCRS